MAEVLVSTMTDAETLAYLRRIYRRATFAELKGLAALVGSDLTEPESPPCTSQATPSNTASAK